MQNALQQENLRVLKTQYPDFHYALTSKEFSNPDMKVSEIPGTNNYLVQSGDISCNLHSSYNIEREMQQLFKPLPNEDNQVILIFGLGYGHCLDYIKKMRIKYKKVIVFEPKNNILVEVLKKRTLQEVFGRPNIFVHIFKLANEMAQDLLREALGSKTVKILFHVSYMTVYKDLYDNILRTFRSEKNSVNTSISTFHYFSTEWNKHQLKSMKTTSPGASILAGKFTGVPGIIASAGPSLNKHFDLLRAIEDRAVIVSPGTSSRIFNDQGIQSHLSMSTDSQVYQGNFYLDFKLKSKLIGSYRLHPNVAENFPNEILRIVLDSEFLSRYYNKWHNWDYMLINDHSSVASVAVDFLVELGCNPIILIGQDLCYYDNKLYAGDQQNEVSGHYENKFEDVDIYGNKVYTYSGFKAMQNDMELLNIKYQSKVKIYNATEGGLNIHGIENVKFQDIYDTVIADRPNTVTGVIDEAIAGSKIRSDTGTQEGKSNADFFAHVLVECEAIETVLKEKEESFLRLDKLKVKNAKASRLNNEIFYIQSFNKQLEANTFYTNVIFPNIQQQLTYYKASSNYISDSGEDYEGAELYERKLDQFVLDMSQRLKALVLTELSDDVPIV